MTELVDAQIHDVQPRAAWSSLVEDQPLEASVELAVAAMDAVGVSAALVNPILGAPAAEAHLRRFPDRFGAVLFTGPRAEIDGSVEAYVEQLRATPGIVGIRLILAHPRDDTSVAMFRAGLFEPFFAAADAHQLPVFVTMHGALPELHAVLRAHPDLTVVLDHLGLDTPPVTGPPSAASFDEVPDVVALAAFDNVAVKLTGVPSLSEQGYPFADVWPAVHAVLDAFGVERMMWGSDFTRCRTLHSYRESVDFLLLTDEVSPSEKEQLFSGSIRRWIGWPAAPSTTG